MLPFCFGKVQELSFKTDHLWPGISVVSTGQVRVLCAYGHDHTQACDKKDPATGLCIDILTGADLARISDESSG